MKCILARILRGAAVCLLLCAAATSAVVSSALLAEAMRGGSHSTRAAIAYFVIG